MNRPNDKVERPPEGQYSPPKPARSVWQQIERVLWGIAVILVLIFVVQNVPAVRITYLAWTFSFSLGLLVIITLAVGMLLGWALTALLRRRARGK
ncbi:MAG TPA: LapA family protein [Gammaproteobacteria bacterium]|nr:LapA family protein [Gammaproteobacteria bacterium]